MEVRCPNLRSVERKLYLVPDLDPAKCELRDVIYSLAVIKAATNNSDQVHFSVVLKNALKWRNHRLVSGLS